MNQLAVSGYFNHLFNQAYKWAQFVNEGGEIPLYEVHQNWLAPNLAAWTEHEANGASVTMDMGTATSRQGPWLKLAVPGDSAAAGGIYSQSVMRAAFDTTNLRAVMEFSVDSTAIAGTGAYTFHVGLVHDETLETSTEDYVKIVKNSTSANWLFKTRDDVSETSTNTGVAATGVQRFRIMLYGSAQTGGARAECYIDNVLVATNTANLPNTETLALSTLFYNNTVLIATVNVYVSPITLKVFAS